MIPIKLIDLSKENQETTAEIFIECLRLAIPSIISSFVFYL